jgi:hypothetical protein
MLKGNLSTRPFYNDRLVTLVLLLVAVGAIALSAFNVTQLVSLSKERGALDSQIEKDEREIQALAAKTAGQKQALDASVLKLLSVGAEEANELIDRRTFSWTEFLGVIETTLPIGARLVEVAPKPEKNVMHVGIVVVCKTPDDLYTLLEALEKTGFFKDVVPASRNPNEDGTETATIEAIYLAPGGAGAPDPARKTGTVPR